MSNKSHYKLETIGDVSQLLAKTINQLARDEIDGAKASKIGYLANILIGSLKDGDIEDRIKRIETLLNKTGGSGKNL